MLPAILAATLLLPQGSRQRPTPVRYLPGDRTLISLEFPDPALLRRCAEQVFQLHVMDLPPVRAALKAGAARGRLFPRLMQKRSQLVKLLMDFDRGFVVATVFPSERKHGMGISLSGMASKSAPLRDHPQRILSLFRADPNAKDATAGDNRSFYGPRPATRIVDEPLADTPVRAYWLDFDQNLGPNEWSYWNDSFAFAYKSRQAVFHALSYTRKGSKQDVQQLLADLLGVGKRGEKFEYIGHPRKLAENEQLVARLQMQFGKARDNKSSTPERMRAEMVEAGFGSFVGARSDLIATKADDASVALREEIELHDGKEERSLFRVFRSTGFGIRQAAGLLPEGTIACAKVGFDPVELQNWLSRIAKINRISPDEMDLALRITRGVTGLGGKARHKALLDGLTELVVAIVPPAAGSPLFEPVFVFPLGERKDAVKTTLNQFAALLTRLGGAARSETKMRAYGKGEDSVSYLRLRDYFPDAPTQTGIAMRLLGGGFLSATEIAGHLVVGCNPKSLKQIRKAQKSGEVLAKLPEFVAALGAEKDRPLEVYMDFERLSKGLGAAGVMGQLIPLFMLGVGPGGRAGGMETVLASLMTSLPNAMKGLSREVLVADETEFGYRLTLSGGTLLSPVGWAGFAYAMSLLDTMANLAR